MKLQVGDKAPEFEGVNQNGDTIKLSDYKGKTVILYFYPKDNTPTCTVESCNLRDNYTDLKKDGFEVIGVSADSAKKHSNFINKFDLPFDLLADTEKEVINKYGVWGPKKFMGREFDGIIRTTFVINQEGVISHIFEKVKAKEHTAQIREAMAAKA